MVMVGEMAMLREESERVEAALRVRLGGQLGLNMIKHFHGGGECGSEDVVPSGCDLRWH